MAGTPADSFWGSTDGGHLVQLQWDRTMQRVTANPQGTTGWARVLATRGAAAGEGEVVRVHKCAQNPCEARWPSAKYGVSGPPLHVQVVSEAPSASSEASAVAGALPTAKESPPAIPSPAPAVAETDTPLVPPEATAAADALPAAKEDIQALPSLAPAVADAAPPPPFLRPSHHPLTTRLLRSHSESHFVPPRLPLRLLLTPRPREP